MNKFGWWALVIIGGIVAYLVYKRATEQPANAASPAKLTQGTGGNVPAGEGALPIFGSVLTAIGNVFTGAKKQYQTTASTL